MSVRQCRLKSFEKHRWLGSPPEFDSVGMECGPKMSISNKFPGDAGATAPGTTL